MQKAKDKETVNNSTVSSNNFIDLLKSEDYDKIRDYVAKNGKIKPYCPIIFHNTNNNNE